MIYYEANNDAPYTAFRNVELAINRFHWESWVGWLAYRLYYRSMLYTYVVEKVHFYRMRKQLRIVPELRRFQTQLRKLFELLRSNRVTPVLVLQVTRFEPAPEMRDLSLDDEEQIQALALRVANAQGSSTADKITRTRVSIVQVFVEAARRVGIEAGAQVSTHERRSWPTGRVQHCFATTSTSPMRRTNFWPRKSPATSCSRASSLRRGHGICNSAFSLTGFLSTPYPLWALMGPGRR